MVATWKHLNTINNGVWMNSDALNAVLCIFAEHHHLGDFHSFLPHLDSGVLFANTHFYQKMALRDTSFMQRSCSSCYLFSGHVRRLVFLMNLSDCHWITCCLDFENKRVMSATSIHHRCVICALSYPEFLNRLQAIFSDPFQNDPPSAAIGHVKWFMQLHARNAPPHMRPCEVELVMEVSSSLLPCSTHSRPSCRFGHTWFADAHALSHVLF